MNNLSEVQLFTDELVRTATQGGGSRMIENMESRIQTPTNVSVYVRYKPRGVRLHDHPTTNFQRTENRYATEDIIEVEAILEPRLGDMRRCVVLRVDRKKKSIKVSSEIYNINKLVRGFSLALNNSMGYFCDKFDIRHERGNNGKD